MANKMRKKTPAAIFERLSPNRTSPRNKMIRRLTPHCVAGNLTIEATLGLARFINADSKSGASCNYAIGTDGRIGLGVEETNRAWTSSSANNDHEAITFEIANNGSDPDWRMSDAAINGWLDAAVEMSRFYGFKKVNYLEKPADIASAQVETWIKTWAKPDEMIITLHNWYAAKACPGPYFMRQLPWLVREMNKRLADSSYVSEAFVGEGGASAAPQEAFKEYHVTITTPALNIRSRPGSNASVVRTLVNDKNIYTIAEESNGPGATKWGRLKSGAGWISLDFTKRR
jgi:hypothetical protein